MTGALGLVATIRMPKSDDEEEYVPADDPPEDLYTDEDITQHYHEQPGDFINQQSWRLLMHSYVAVAETCSPPASFRKVKDALGWHQREQKVFRDMLVSAGLAVVDANGVLAWTSTKAQRRMWLSSTPFPVTAPPQQKAPYPTLDPSPEVL
jgi:hypothetical protein